MRFITSLAIILSLTTATNAAEQKIVDNKGKTIAVLLDCNSCKSGKGDTCVGGVTDGFHGGKRCGQCLIDSNFGVKLLYDSDLELAGAMKTRSGEPLVEQFVRLFLPNAWTVRTRTQDKGAYTLMLGATLERSGQPVRIDLGTRSLPKLSEKDYALYMLPEGYKPCEDQP